MYDEFEESRIDYLENQFFAAMMQPASMSFSDRLNAELAYFSTHRRIKEREAQDAQV